jgi:hypothetical protein
LQKPPSNRQLRRVRPSSNTAHAFGVKWPNVQLSLKGKAAHENAATIAGFKNFSRTLFFEGRHYCIAPQKRLSNHSSQSDSRLSRPPLGKKRHSKSNNLNKTKFQAVIRSGLGQARNVRSSRFLIMARKKMFRFSAIQ